MRMPTLTCNRCGKEDTLMVDAPHLDDPRVYCIQCYAELFPPGQDMDEFIAELYEEPPATERVCDVFKFGHCDRCDHPCNDYFTNHGYRAR